MITREIGHGVSLEMTDENVTRVIIEVPLEGEAGTRSVVLARAWALLADAIATNKVDDDASAPGTETPPSFGAWWQG